MAASRKSSSISELIVRKRNGGALSEEEIRSLISGFMKGAVADYQMSALAMAIYFQGMTFDETAALTLAMRDSGKVLSLNAIDAPKIGKHSTGGVGDKVSMPLAPILAACGVIVPKMSGRGLGHTGGTLDKLEAIPGFRVDLSIRELKTQLRAIGCAIVGQTEDMAPADRRLYAIRDVTGTVESIPLIVSSILSKKLAEGTEAVVLDVKSGRGAFMKTPEDAKELARCLVRVGRRSGKRVSALITDMNSPIGRTIGNALETREALEMLHGEGPDDLQELVFAIGAEMLMLAGTAKSRADAIRQQRRALDDGNALTKMRALVEAQGGDARVVDEPDRLQISRHRVVVTAPKPGYVRAIDPYELGRTSMTLGAGRMKKDDPVDLGAGIRLHVQLGDRVEAGGELATLYTSKRATLEACADRARESFELGTKKPATESRIIETIRR